MSDFVLSPEARLDLLNICKDLADEPLRFWRVYTYLIIYRFESKPIEIVRVLSAYRDIRKLLD